MKFFYGIISVLLLVRVCMSLKSMRIRVPEVVKSGDTVTLSCDYDLEQVALYTVKWYWQDVEFYRFVPKEAPPSKAFAMKHINVDISRSGPTQVTLRGVRRELTGYYKCEVSADGPLFHTDIQTGHMIVAEVPTDNPTMKILQVRGDSDSGKIRAECYSPGSDPAANLTWFINEEQVSEEDDLLPTTILYQDTETDRALGLHSSRAGIEIAVIGTSHLSLFASGAMTIRCEASIYTVWRRSVVEVIRKQMPQIATVLGATASQSHVDDNNIYGVKLPGKIDEEENSTACRATTSIGKSLLLFLGVTLFT